MCCTTTQYRIAVIMFVNLEMALATTMMMVMTMGKSFTMMVAIIVAMMAVMKIVQS